MTITFYWQLIYSNYEGLQHSQTTRAKVIGGWIVNQTTWTNTSESIAVSESSVFVPDPEHKWEV